MTEAWQTEWKKEVKLLEAKMSHTWSLSPENLMYYGGNTMGSVIQITT